MTWTPSSDSLSLGLRIFVLNPPFPISRRLILQQARGQVLFPPTACQHTVSCSISLPLRGFSFNFPSLYYFAIGHLGVFSLTRWSSLIHTGFHVAHATWDKTEFFWNFWLLDFHHLWCRIQLLRLAFFRRIVRFQAASKSGAFWRQASNQTIHTVFPLPQSYGLVWAVPIPLAATLGIAFAFYSFSYWDVSIH